MGVICPSGGGEGEREKPGKLSGEIEIRKIDAINWFIFLF